MADGTPGMPWKDALKRLKEFHQAGADGSPASMQKELEGLEESLKGWEQRDERRERCFEIYKEDGVKLRAEVAKQAMEIRDLRMALDTGMKDGLEVEKQRDDALAIRAKP